MKTAWKYIRWDKLGPISEIFADKQTEVALKRTCRILERVKIAINYMSNEISMQIKINLIFQTHLGL